MRGIALISEYKRCAPGRFVAYIEPWTYSSLVAGFSTAFSVLTEPYWFCGSPDIIQVFLETGLPVLHKDFVVGRGQLLQAACHGASAALVILDTVGWRSLDNIYSQARDMGLDLLVETFRGGDAAAVAGSYPGVAVGINSRDLSTLKVDYMRMLVELELASSKGPGRALYVAESGIDAPDKAAEAVGRGAKAVLVGTAMMKKPELAREIIEAVKGRLSSV
ncbi:indole-3-glycerol phosphate synthase [Aeropyrum camini SY1 = JCM 12091]|uniref:indole-3-glycerol-phosphate synthase n=2 Tax=Aeropyrum camini TaxID=229980 RepID=U3T7K2_9CREN|nr:indole-3-glycerol phosphate synthase [Aeropyrum camini SY1 = JCM 12091]